MKYEKHFNTKNTPQSEPIPGKNQVEDSAKGFVFEVKEMDKLTRFLILGTEGGTYYISEKKLTVQNANVVKDLLRKDGAAVVEKIVEISTEGRAHKNEPALFALAMATSPCFANLEVRRLAFDALSKVARIGTHLFQFMVYRNAFAGEGRSLRRAVQNWYLDKSPEKLAYQVAKYQQRNGWSHRDVLRVAHPKTSDSKMNTVLKWAIDKTLPETGAPNILYAMHHAHSGDVSKPERINLILNNGLTREMIPTEWLKEAAVWEALLVKMPIGAMIRNLGNMSKVGLLKPLSDVSKEIVTKLGNEEVLQKARIHPLGILAALFTYGQGKGMKGSGTWEVVPQVVDALDDTFYKTFKFIEPTGKNFLLGVDVSGSMGEAYNGYKRLGGGYSFWSHDVGGIPGLSPRIAAACMAMVTARTEQNYHIMGFSSTFMDLKITAKDTLQSASKKTGDLPFSGTDCALPMIYATQHNLDVDTFVVYTDNETWSGGVHPIQALEKYRQKSGRNAKLIVCGMVTNNFTIADPNDPGMLDVVGFDSATPQIISEFSRG